MSWQIWFNMTTVNTKEVAIGQSMLNSVNNDIFNVILQDPNSSNEIISKIKSGEIQIPALLKSFVYTILQVTPTRKSTAPLYGNELHEYLWNLRVLDKNIEKLTYPDYSNRNLKELITFLKGNGNKIFQFHTRNLLSSYCRYGYVLECVFHIHREQWRRKEITEPFNNYV